MHAIELLPASAAIPGNPEWHELRRQGITASEIAAVMGISPWESAFSLYWKKVSAWDSVDNEFMSAGRHLEDAIADWWFAEMDPLENLKPARAGLYANPDRPWQIATPDRLILGNECVCAAAGDVLCSCMPTDGPLLALLECKWVAYSWDGWGEPGTDNIPVYYRAQALWQLDVLGVDEVHFAVLGPGGFRAYLVRRDEADLEVMRRLCADFMYLMDNGIAPDLDSHSATLTTLRKLHPSAGDGDVEVSVELAEAYQQARADKKDAEARVDECSARIRDALGSEFNRAVCNGKLVASRSVYDQSGDSAELTALEDDWPVVDRLNPGRASSYER